MSWADPSGRWDVARTGIGEQSCHPGLDATNWRAKQTIRPAVVNRKVWGGNYNPAGAQKQLVLMSVLRTCARQHRDAIGFVSRHLCAQHPRLNLSTVCL